MELKLKPIGVIHTQMRTKFDAPHQPSGNKAARNVIELLPDMRFEQAVLDLKGFDRIWLIWWFHKNEGWRARVRPPRGGSRKHGVLATRSPHRPNPIGITCVKLLEVDGRRLIVGEVDLVDGTPTLDIKPYLPKVDAFPNVCAGWVDEIEREESSPPSYQVKLSKNAEQQLNWLNEAHQVNFLDRAKEILERDPSPHRTRRISKYGKEFRMGCGPWRLFFTVNDKIVRVDRVACGYPESSLKDSSKGAVPDREAQLGFLDKFGSIPAADENTRS